MVVGTPGRVVDHLSNTKGFSLRGLKHLVLDEADKRLDMDFEQEIDQILKVGGEGGSVSQSAYVCVVFTLWVCREQRGRPTGCGT